MYQGFQRLEELKRGRNCQSREKLQEFRLEQKKAIEKANEELNQ